MSTRVSDSTRLPITLHTIRTEATHVPSSVSHPDVDTLDPMVTWTAGTRVIGGRALDTIALVSWRTVATLGLAVGVVARDSRVARVVNSTVVTCTRDPITCHVNRTWTTRVVTINGIIARNSGITW